tara:strand:+ start:225 stop:404 length:180 start_codon:yes stop_codon:yes gene_type:complete
MKTTNKAGNSLPKRPSKKSLLREIAETDSPLLKGGDFDYASLERTNITNLMLILGMLKG